jgi:superfamily II DNA or RNA helicase
VYRFNNGNNELLTDHVSYIKEHLSKKIVDINLYGLAVEPVENVTYCGMNRLIDFTVESAASFNANGLLVHNCDKATSESYKNLFRHYFRGRRRYGLSATPFDPDKPVEALVVQEHLGSVIVKEKRQTVLDRGRIVPCIYRMITVGMEGDISEASAYDIAYTDWILQNTKFHTLIANLCEKFKNGGTLILVDRRELGNALENIINSIGLKSSFIHGDTPKHRRNEILKEFESRNLNVLIGGKIINRGLDLAGGCETLIMAGGGKLQSDLLQKVGRAFRLNSQGYSRVFDFFFRCNRYLYCHSKQRLKAALNEDFDVKIILPGGVLDGRELVEKNFRIHKKYIKKA